MKQITLEDNEYELLLKFLEELGNRLGCEGCNDYTLKYTPDNVKLIKNITRHEFDPKDVKEELEMLEKRGKKDIITSNTMILYYLIDSIKKSPVIE